MSIVQRKKRFLPCAKVLTPRTGRKRKSPVSFDDAPVLSSQSSLFPSQSSLFSSQSSLFSSQSSVRRDGCPTQFRAAGCTSTPDPPDLPDLYDPDALYTGYIRPERRMMQSLPPDPPPQPAPTPTSSVLPDTPSSPVLPDTPSTPSTPLQQTSSSFPDSPAPRLQPTPNPSLSPYPAGIQPLDRDFALDYEACMTAVQDLNRMTNLVFSGRVRTGRVDDLQVPVSREDVLPVLLELRDMLNRFYDRLNI